MYVESVPNRNSPPAILLRESFREDGKVKKRTLANLSMCPPHAIDALKAALKGEPAFAHEHAATPLHEQFTISASLAHGHVAAVLSVLRNLGLPRLIDRSDSPERKILLALIAARILFPNSKLATLRFLAPEALVNSDDEEDRPLLGLTPSSTLGDEIGLDLETLSLKQIYAAMRWLFKRQKRIERGLAKKHLQEGALALYDLSSTYVEGETCPLAQYGHNRDKKKGKRQINFGLLCDQQGRPLGCEVFAGNVGDPNTVSSQVVKLRKDFGLKKIVLVGDRGMLTQARIDEELRHIEGLAWISALNGKSVRALVDGGAVQPELFEDYGVAEIQSPAYPEERLVVCYNPLLAEKRARKREELLEITEKKLAEIQEATQRTNNPYRGKDRLGRRVQREAGKYRMLKHYDLEIEEKSFSYVRNKESIQGEAAVDGFYIVRAGRIPKEEMGGETLVDSYKKLSNVERAFRTLKSIDLKVRPIWHRDPEMVRAHIFLCTLAYYVEWHMREALAPMLFTDEHKEVAREKRKNAAEPVKKSAQAKGKAEKKRDQAGRPLHSFTTLMEHLKGIVRNKIEPGIKEIPAFSKETTPDALQSRALELLGLTSGETSA